MRFLIADDQPILREAVRAQIELHLGGAMVVEAGSVEQLLNCLNDGRALFDIVLLNFGMRDMSMAVLQRVTAQRPGVPIAVLSVPSGSDAIRQCIDAGARGFIPRTATGEQLVHAVRLMLAGGTTVPAAAFLRIGVADGLDPIQSCSQTAAPVAGWTDGLNQREHDILHGVARGESNKEIARGLDVAEVTVKFHLRVLFRKAGVKSRAQLAAAAAKAGLT